MKKYNLKIIDIKSAFEVWKTSPNKNIFNNPEFLKNFDNIEFYLVTKGNEPICCWPIYKKNNSMMIPNFFYYFGPFWSKILTGIPSHSLLSETKNVYGKYIEYFVNNFDNINFQLHYSLTDVRIFDWWNYENKHNKKFTIKPKYTAIIENPFRENIASTFRYVRRYEIKNFKKHESKIEKCSPILKEILDLYLGNIDQVANSNKINDLKKDFSKIFNLINEGFGEIECYREKSSKKIVYCSICLNDDFSKHLIIACAKKDWRKNGIMAWALNQNFSKSIVRRQLFDFNGANSPKRGDDKHSYGAIEKLFFEFEY